MTTHATPLTAPGPSWPALSLAEVEARLTAPGAPFEMATLDIRGVPTRVWKNAPPTMLALLDVARGWGSREFAILGDERVSYTGFVRAVGALAQALHERGVAKGDRVAIAMRNLPEWPVALFAAAACGAIAVPLNAWWTGQELTYALKDSGATLLIADAERMARVASHLADLPDLTHRIVTRGEAEGAERLDALIGAPNDWANLPDTPLPAVDLAPDDHATIFYTSGTTGHPKGALGTHRNLMTNILSGGYAGARNFLRRGEPIPEPRPRISLTVIPLFHVTACSAGLMGLIASGGTMVLMHRWDAVEAMRLIERERVNMTGGVPTIAWQLIEHPERDRYDLSSLEMVSYGGAPSAPELVRRIASDLKASPGNGWGMTETMATVTSHTAEDYLHRPDSAGPPVPVSELAIRDPDTLVPLPVGEVGELWAKGPQIVVGYWNKPEATAETFVDGWVRTGDLARLDEEGFLFIVDRAKDVVIRGGENIYAAEVENALYEHPAVSDAAVVGIPHHTLGEEPAAVVRLMPGAHADEAELRAFVAERIAGFKVPVRVLFLDETLPRNANGKILKRELKALFA